MLRVASGWTKNVVLGDGLEKTCTPPVCSGMWPQQKNKTCQDEYKWLEISKHSLHILIDIDYGHVTHYPNEHREGVHAV